MADTENEISGTEDHSDKGFPAQTKIVDMTPEQQAAYWKFQSRKHESALRSKQQAESKPEPKTEAKPEAPLDAAALRKEILAEIKREQAPDLARSKFEALIGDRLSEKQRNAILDDLNYAKFVSEDGSIDTDAIKAKAELIAPAEEQSSSSPRRRTHQGARRQERTSSVQSGKDLFESERKNKRGSE